MIRRAALCCAALATATLACLRSATEQPPGAITSALVALAAQFGADADATTRAFADLQSIALRVEKRHARSPADVADDINAVIFGERGFEREIDSAATRFFSLSSVLADRRGNCLGLGALYLAIGERIGLPLDGILLPGHFFVRTRGLGRHNVELLRRGEALPDGWYRQKYGPWPEPSSAYFRPLTVTELVAIHWFNRGNDLQLAGDLAAAESAYARAAREFPDFAEAQASLGAARQRRGAFTEAEAAYHEAARVWPDLPGLAGNLDLLRQQLAGAAEINRPPDRP